MHAYYQECNTSKTKWSKKHISGIFFLYFDEQETSIITICNIINNISKFLTYDTTVNKNVYLGGERGEDIQNAMTCFWLACLSKNGTQNIFGFGKLVWLNKQVKGEEL